MPLYGTLAYQMRFNQFPAFASAFAMGMWGALLFAKAVHAKWMQNWCARCVSTVAGLGAFYIVNQLLKQLNHAREYQLWQLENRTVLVCSMTAGLVLCALGVPLPGKRLWSFLAAISYNFYLWHQMLTVWLKYKLHLPAWSGETPPNQLGDKAWMAKSSLFYWCAALAMAIFLTLVVEKILLQFTKKNSKKTNSGGTLPAKVV